jgi:2-dehydropantoate 2-reductase
MTDILIYGAGAIGSFLGYLLSGSARNSTGEEGVKNVALLGRGGHMRTIRERGRHRDLGGER